MNDEKAGQYWNANAEAWTALARAGFTIEQLNEPYAGDETVKKQPALQDTQVVAYFLHLRCRKAGGQHHKGALRP
ncbi:MAG: hypothetical protein IPH12_12650 [Saprospirales bacterium]|nr:hypothetical protein [Saprospirales bacterium]MBK8921208.1 hypothetical protein [Saprospirales bacterium]